MCFQLIKDVDHSGAVSAPTTDHRFADGMVKTHIDLWNLWHETKDLIFIAKEEDKPL